MTTLDAARKDRLPIITKNLLNIQVLKRIDNDLDIYEKVHCVFLMIEHYQTGYQTLLDAVDERIPSISRFVVENNVTDWPDKVMEALCLLQNNEVLLKLGVNPDDAQTFFHANITRMSCKINKYAKTFYNLFENLSKDDAVKLQQRIYQQIDPPRCSAWMDENFLEIHLLWWIKKGLITISGDNWELLRILEILKLLNMSSSSAYLALQMYEGERKKNLCVHDQLDINRGSSNLKTNSYVINKGLAIIFNQMQFTGPIEYEYREGSQVDCDRIEEVFKNTFGFDTHVYLDLSRDEIYQTLDEKLCDAKEKYDCVAVFILSHGTSGHIIASDGKSCTIEKIKKHICIDALQTKPKILVIQACQTIEDIKLDGPTYSRNEVDNNRDFILLCSTISGQPSARHPRDGTWYIQVLCDVLENMRGKCIGGEIPIEVQRRFDEKEGIINKNLYRQVPNIMCQTLSKKLILPYNPTAPSN
ncbi:caspase-8 isoform X1 [Neodiprion lecontei]|uniref:Caspase-8 isoform X1 n=1 Tax=Neodiprion lecontei TaxID=441921 RepID=A0A6J0BRU9_NEOLC|nr:caspase-8 isoform X1 [Neodiprion lecontei]XP_015517220.1 caspase-8 isoform X1 [Neodiprion lecontei]XP_015517221.1 caspase-8 isoform X1 [Neodiprion lecontei]XP_046589046.1 caspase-8 isoform X1 [Neodiprion lecontei]